MAQPDACSPMLAWAEAERERRAVDWNRWAQELRMRQEAERRAQAAERRQRAVAAASTGKRVRAKGERKAGAEEGDEGHESEESKQLMPLVLSGPRDRVIDQVLRRCRVGSAHLGGASTHG